MSAQNLTEKVIVLTGASSGFGRGAALAFAKAGASLVLAARGLGSLNEVATECKAAGARTLVVPTDVSQEEAVEALAGAAISEYGCIDVWVNDAGVAAIGRFEEVPLADHLQVIRTDLLGTISGSYFALRHFHERKQGILINIASVIGKIPSPYYGSYTAAKFGIVGLNASLRQELELAKLTDIHVCTVMPMAMDTPFFEHASNYTGKVAEPIPPLYDADKVVETIVALASRPEKEVIVGGMGKVIVAAHQVIPAVVEKMMGKQTDTAQLEKADDAADTEGAVRTPSETGIVHSRRLDKRA
jgi:short-subunit dehydrogenase